jgi:hypothetical protein
MRTEKRKKQRKTSQKPPEPKKQKKQTQPRVIKKTGANGPRPKLSCGI